MHAPLPGVARGSANPFVLVYSFCKLGPNIAHDRGITCSMLCQRRRLPEHEPRSRTDLSSPETRTYPLLVCFNHYCRVASHNRFSTLTRHEACSLPVASPPPSRALPAIFGKGLLHECPRTRTARSRSRCACTPHSTGKSKGARR